MDNNEKNTTVDMGEDLTMTTNEEATTVDTDTTVEDLIIFKNAQYKNEEKTIVNVEINHPSYGWIPYTFNSNEADESYDKEIREYLATANIESYVEPEPAPHNNKVDGEVYTLNEIDYMVSFMKDDANGMLQVKAGFELGLTETVIHFKNGTKMPIKATEFNDFALWFMNKRNQFFV